MAEPRTAASGARPATEAGHELVRRTYGMKVRPREVFEAFVDAILAIEAEAAASLDVEVLRSAIEVAFEEGKEWQASGWHSGINDPVWPFDKFTAIVQREYARLAQPTPAEQRRSRACTHGVRCLR